MGSDNIFWKDKQRKEDLKRKKEARKPAQTFLIVCEGEKTEPNYFRSFNLSNATVEIDGTGRNTKSLIKYIEKTYDIKQFDQVWAVFDKDSFSNENFNAAIKKAHKKKMKVAYSNEAFELWYLLHFHNYNTGMSRDQYKEKLTETLGHEYKKNSTTMYEEIKNRQATAIKNASKLLTNFSRGETPSQRNPSTTVFMLVEEMNRYLK
ncbi:MAG TPA: RloB family protein [bacterium]|nr:RloB family protein [bacterium]HPS29838.1 RloB family protein [bacterium]